MIELKKLMNFMYKVCWFQHFSPFMKGGGQCFFLPQSSIATGMNIVSPDLFLNYGFSNLSRSWYQIEYLISG